jgi:Zn-dependent protease with chaperone function
MSRPDLGAAATFSLAQLCDSAKGDLADLCDVDASLSWLRPTSVAAGGAALTLLGLIVVMGQVAQTDRMMLLALFRSGLYVTAAVATGLILADAAIAIATVYYVEAALFERVYLPTMAFIAIGAVAGVAAVGRSAFRIVQTSRTMVTGKAVTRADAPQLWRHVGQVARDLGARMPEHIVVGLDPGFFVTQADVLTPTGSLAGRTLYCSLPLSRSLTLDEFSAAVGHELGHFRGEDTQFSEHFYPIYQGTTMAMAALQASGGTNWGRVAILPAMAIFEFFLERVATAECGHGRARELLADRAGAEATSPRVMACALVKMHAFTTIWDGLVRSAIAAVQDGKMFKNASVAFADAVRRCAAPAALEGLTDERTTHPTDSHPPLAARLDSLHVDLAAVAAEALVVNPAASAISLLPHVEAEEEALSEIYQGMMAEYLGIAPEIASNADAEPPGARQDAA